MEPVVLRLCLDNGSIHTFGPVSKLEAKVIWLTLAASETGWWYRGSRVVRLRVLPYYN